MYDELVKELRELSHEFYLDDNDEHTETKLKEAADAIEVMCDMVATAHNEFANVIQSYEESKPRWIPVTEQLPEESEGLKWYEDIMLRFTSVWCCDAKNGIVGVRNRLQGKMTGNKYLNQDTKDTDWCWSGAWWEPTHWMPIVPLPELPKEEKDNGV